jgi:hypothetical protein
MSSSGPASACESRIVVREAEVRRRTYGSMPQVVPASKRERERCLPQLMAQGDRRAAASAQQGENPSSLRRHACCATSRASPLHLCVVRRTHLRTAAAPPRDATRDLNSRRYLVLFPLYLSAPNPGNDALLAAFPAAHRPHYAEHLRVAICSTLEEDHRVHDAGGSAPTAARRSVGQAYLQSFIDFGAPCMATRSWSRR